MGRNHSQAHARRGVGFVPRAWLFSCMALAALVTPLTVLSDVRVERLTYGDESNQVLDLYVPAASTGSALPVAVLAHGGLWQGGSRRSLGTLCSNLVERSGERFACASIDYRLSQELGGTCSGTGIAAYRDQAADFALAYAYLQENADELGLDARRLFVGGHSAGAHLAQVLNLRWEEFAAPCGLPGGCPEPLGAVGIEGIFDIPNWDTYDEQFWRGQYSCATRRAFGAPGPDPAACMEETFGERCWDAGSPAFLVAHSERFEIKPAGSVLLIQSPGDNWVDGGETVRLGQALADTYPDLPVVVQATGACGMGSHNDVLTEVALADCIVAFMETESAAPAFRINAGLSDAWFDPDQPGQGFLVTVWEDIETMFVAWFTYDVERPPAEATAILGEPGHRWLTAQGTYGTDTAELDLFLTSGGVFDAASPPVGPAEKVGSLTVRFSGCNAAVISYDLQGSNRSGEITVQRIVPDNVALCEALF